MTTSRRLVRDIVCAYTTAELPTSWLQVFRRFERAFARAKLRVRVRLLPIEDLPERFEVLVVPPDLAARAAALDTDAHLITTTRQHAGDAATHLLRVLQEGTFLYAERVTPNDTVIVIHRGSEIL